MSNILSAVTINEQIAAHHIMHIFGTAGFDKKTICTLIKKIIAEKK